MQQSMQVDYIEETKKSTKNGDRIYYPIGKNLCTDKIGYSLIKQMDNEFAGKPKEYRKDARIEGLKLLQKLKGQGRLWRRNDKSPVY
jgi:hypothetical protein